MANDEQPKSLAQDLFEDMGRKVENMDLKGEEPGDSDDRQKMVEEVESYCVNCGENVRPTLSFSAGNRLMIARARLGSS
jgi:hypothetical protein